jgi:hypothetical protein
MKKILSILISIAAVFAMVIPTVAYADPPHCDRTGYPSCYTWDKQQVVVHVLAVIVTTIV